MTFLMPACAPYIWRRDNLIAAVSLHAPRAAIRRDMSIDRATVELLGMFARDDGYPLVLVRVGRDRARHVLAVFADRQRALQVREWKKPVPWAHWAGDADGEAQSMRHGDRPPVYAVERKNARSFSQNLAAETPRIGEELWA